MNGNLILFTLDHLDLSVKIICTTRRLILREFEESDASSAFNLNKNPEVLQYTGDEPFVDEEDARLFLRNYGEYTRNGFGRWAVILRDNNTFLGWCGLKLHEDGMVDLGYRFMQEFWGNGYATEASFACLEYGFKQLHISEIISRILPENKPSIRLAQRLGMTFWKTGKCDDWEDANYFRITKKEFDNSSGL